MAFDWQEYLNLSDGLVTMTLESAKRSAISRAYYAAFHKAEGLYRHYNPTYASTDNSQTHYVVWKWFESHSSRNYKKVGVAGFNLKRQRETANYRDEYPGIEQQATYQVARAKGIIADLNSISSPPTSP